MPKKHTSVAQNIYLESIRGQDLDRFLELGWYRMGPSIFTSHYIHYNNDLYSAIWLRTDLKDYKLSKSLRKINRKNKAILTHVAKPYQYSEELEQLYQVYRKGFKGNLPEFLDSYMMDSLDMEIFDTAVIKIYDSNKLIACSIFDIGTQTIASIFGFYDPEYSHLSLGLYTMLLEIEFCQAQNMDFYYVGYFVPGNPRFDYKLRLGHTEYLDFKTESWLSIDSFDYESTPLKVSKKKLQKLHLELPKQRSTLFKNAYIDAHIIEYFSMRYLEAPLLLRINDLDKLKKENEEIMCTYDVRKEQYLLLLCQELPTGFSNYNPSWINGLDDKTYKKELVIIKVLKKCKTKAPIRRWLANNQ